MNIRSVEFNPQQQKERRNLLIFCTTIIAGASLDISIAQLEPFGYSLEKIDICKLRIMVNVALGYFFVTHLINFLSVTHEPYRYIRKSAFNDESRIHPEVIKHMERQNFLQDGYDESDNECYDPYDEVDRAINRRYKYRDVLYKNYYRLNLFVLFALPILMLILAGLQNNFNLIGE